MNKILHKYYLVFALIFSYVLNLSAQSISDTVKIKEINIYDSNLPLADISVIEIDSVTKEYYSNNSLSELLSNSSFVNIKDYGKGSFASASIRGAGASHTQVRWNGININSPLTGQVDLSLIPIGFVDELTIKQGGNSITDQSGGLGGSIVLNNSNNRKKGFHFKLSKEIASFSSTNSFIKIGYGTKKWHFRSRVMSEKARNNFTFNNTALLPNELCTLTNANTKQFSQLHEISYRASEQDILSFMIWQNSMERNIPALMSYEGAGHNEKQSNSSIRSVLRWQRFTNRGFINIQSAYVFETLDYFLEHSTSGGDISVADSKSYTNSFLNQIKYKFEKEKSFNIDVQLDFNMHSVDVNDLKNNLTFKKQRTEIALFTGVKKQLSEYFSAFLFIRNNLTDNIINPVSPSLGIEYLPWKNPALKLKASVTRNFRLPTLNDLYYIPGGNPELKPEKGLSEEISLDYKIKFRNIKSRSNLTFYSSRISDWILWHPTQFGYWTPENIQSVLSQGFELSNTIEGNSNSIKFRLLSLYSFNKTTKESESDLYKNEQLIYQPINNLHLSLSISKDKYSINFNSSFTGKQYTSYGEDREFGKLDSYFLHNVRLSRHIEYLKLNAELIFQINNVLNKSYESIRLRAMPGRNYTLNFKINF